MISYDNVLIVSIWLCLKYAVIELLEVRKIRKIKLRMNELLKCEKLKNKLITILTKNVMHITYYIKEINYRLILI